ncbi:hypothetical protein FRC09_005085 [Ceratobasidium sp. 395]|nr:hypothetical protein FRC09_005085 [Ceratobasidium sp. 395]
MSSGDSTPGSPRYSDRNNDSDTTPSPSGYRSSPLDSEALSCRLALYDASRSLSHAAETLAVAAEAMSKAAASLALASGKFTDSGAYRKHGDLEDVALDSPLRESLSGDNEWQQTAYVLSDPAQPTECVQNRSTEEFAPIEPFPSTSSQIDQAPSLDIINQEINSGPNYATHASECATDTQCTNSHTSAIPTGMHQASVIHNGMNDTHNSENVLDMTPSFTPAQKTSTVSNISNDVAWDTLNSTNPSEETTKPSASHESHRRSCVILDQSFDELPAAALLCKRHPKTICFWRYWNAACWIAEKLKIMTSLSVIYTSSPKQKKLDQIFSDFLQTSYPILLWPTDTPLPESANSSLDFGIQAVHISILSEPNRRINFVQSLVVVSTHSVINMGGLDDLTKNYPIDAINGTCNEQGDDAALHSARAVLRKSFTKKTSVQFIYKAYIKYHITHNPDWSDSELLSRANSYARDHLLRGDSSLPGEMVGGSISMTESQIRAMRS